MAWRFLARRMAAWQAFLREHAAARQRTDQRGRPAWRRRAAAVPQPAVGPAGPAAFLDGRQYRSAQACRAEGAADKGSVRPAQCAALSDTARSFLGWTQEQWLYRQLAERCPPA